MSFLRPLLREPAGSCTLRNTRNGCTLADRLVAAFDSATRRRGLLGRARLDDGEAMIIAPSNAIHTCFMKFPIDVAFVTRDGRVVKTSAAVNPWRAAAALQGYAVIEMRAGTLARFDTVAGDVLEISTTA